MFDEALYAAEALGQGEDFHLVEDRERLVHVVVGELEGDHAAEVAHLLLRQRVAGVGGQAGIPYPSHLRVVVEHGGEAVRILAVALHAEVQGLRAPKREEAVHGAGCGPCALDLEPQLLGPLVRVGAHRSQDEVGVAAEILRGGVEDHVRPEGQGLLEVGGGERVVHHNIRVVGVAQVTEGFDVDDPHERIGGGLHPEELRVLRERRFHPAQIAQVHERRVDVEWLKDLPHEPVRAAVEVVGGHHVVAGPQALHDRVDAGHPRAERDAVLGPFEAGEIPFESGPRGIGDARVLVPLVPARGLLSVRGGLIDGCHDRPGGGIGLLARVHRAGAKSGMQV